MEQLDEVWVLGGTGRIAKRAAAMLAKNGARTVLVGRNAVRLDEAAAETGAAETLSVDDPTAMADAIRRQRPAVVVNTVGPFATTSQTLAEACLPTTSYVDIANDMTSAAAIIELDETARRHGRTLVTGAGFGVVGTEAPLTLLCDGRPAPARVRVDSAASLAIPAGTLGQAMSDTLIDMFSTSGRHVVDGRFASAPIGSSSRSLTLPDGSTVMTGAWPSADLIAAHRVSGAPEIVAATTEVPTGRVARAALPMARAALRVRGLRRLATRGLATMRLRERPMTRADSWGHASAEWPDGQTQDAWLRAGDANDFTARVLAEAALRILHGHASPGAGTPIRLLGADLVETAGGEVYLS
ncbi:hypothetical protein ACFWHT_04710 [Microbacterium sp. NPDC058342]|uniref:hypothetical protein n=1 Tax=Microbacterium sp. NPDC058342 TaxID=3346454 RepID=UPI00366374DD